MFAAQGQWPHTRPPGVYEPSEAEGGRMQVMRGEVQ